MVHVQMICNYSDISTNNGGQLYYVGVSEDVDRVDGEVVLVGCVSVQQLQCTTQSHFMLIW